VAEVQKGKGKLSEKGEQPAGGPRIDIGGNVEGSTLIVAGRDVSLFPQKPSVYDLVQQATRMLRVDDYDRTLEICTQIFVDEPQHPEANLIAGIALLRGRSADRLRDKIVARVEKHLHRAIEDTSTAPTALVVLGIVKYDHYVVNGLFEGKPTLKQVLHLLQREGYHRINQEFLQYVSGSSSAKEYLGITQRE
jgi:hypothetical protein